MNAVLARVVGLLLLSLSCWPHVVHADATTSDGFFTRDTYPRSFVPRPLVLPPWLGQAAFSLDVDDTPTATTETLGASLALGLPGQLESGVRLGIPLSPDSSFGSVIAHLQYAPIGWFSLRAGAGAERVGAGAGSSLGFALEMGAPMKLLLGPRLAFLAGSDIVHLVFTEGMAAGYVQAEIGLVADLWDERFAVRLRTGLREGIADSPAYEQIPVDLDLLASLLPSLDLIVTVSVAGTIDTGVAGRSAGFADERTLLALLQARF